eukprot:5424324-Karenia_brevis.AAC.1
MAGQSFHEESKTRRSLVQTLVLDELLPVSHGAELTMPVLPARLEHEDGWSQDYSSAKLVARCFFAWHATNLASQRKRVGMRAYQSNVHMDLHMGRVLTARIRA